MAGKFVISEIRAFSVARRLSLEAQEEKWSKMTLVGGWAAVPQNFKNRDLSHFCVSCRAQVDALVMDGGEICDLGNSFVFGSPGPLSLEAQEEKWSKMTLPREGPAVTKNFKNRGFHPNASLAGPKSMHVGRVAGKFVISGIRAFLGRPAGFLLRPKRKMVKNDPSKGKGGRAQNFRNPMFFTPMRPSPGQSRCMAAGSRGNL